MKLKLVLFIIGFGLLFSCNRKTEYEKVKQRELASGKVSEEIFLGIHFGMPRKEFFRVCWEMNKEGILMNGAHALRVQHKPQLPSGEMSYMYFYPKFEQEKIFYMQVEFQYMDWFPTNTKFSAENLVDDVVAYFEGMYGEGFFRVEDSEGAFAMVKIDGNRLIRVYVKSRSEVKVDILDLRVKDIKDIAS
jgi:hypothetical protein